MSKLLVGDFYFPEENILRLTDKKANKKNILAKMDWLYEDAQPGDRLVFHFSGHGSYVPDDNGDEPDGKDKILCLADMDFDDPDNFFRDDEIGEWTKRLLFGVELLLMFDSCHSGTASRDLV